MDNPIHTHAHIHIYTIYTHTHTQTYIHTGSGAIASECAARAGRRTGVGAGIWGGRRRGRAIGFVTKESSKSRNRALDILQFIYKVYHTVNPTYII
jgi:hypothetical protein